MSYNFIQQKQQLFRLIDCLPGLLFYCHNDDNFSLHYVSQGALELTGYEPNEFIGKRNVCLDKITHPQDLDLVKSVIKNSILTGEKYQVEYRIFTKTGEEKWVLEIGDGIFADKGKSLGIEGFISDITGFKKNQLALEEAEAKYHSIFENAIVGIFQTTSDGHYIDANLALARIYGYNSVAELITNLTDISHQLYVEENRRKEFINLLQKKDFVSDFESEVYRQDGSIIWISENARAVRDNQGTLLYYEGIVKDITEYKKDKEKLLYYAFHDPVTGLANRALFMDRLRQSVERAKRNPNYLFALLFLDLDRFKLVNDSLGHLIGDKLLIGIARRLEECLRTIDTVARLGGDEFTIILEDLEEVNDAIKVANRIIKAVKEPFIIDQHEIFTATSIGIAVNGKITYPVCPAYNTAEDLLRDADTALYRAKSLGKSRCELFDISMHKKAVDLLELETDLRHALDRDELKIYYQPIYSLLSNKITGFEAVLRWQNPKKGLIFSHQFTKIAEETGLIVTIGWWFLRQSCEQLKIWQEQFNNPDLYLNVNLSAKQLINHNLIKKLDEILAISEIKGESLFLGLSENVLFKHSHLLDIIITQLKERNIKLCLDNFGRDHTSLNLINQLPLNLLKIDHSFFAGQWQNHHEQTNKNRDYQLQIVKGIVMLAENLGMKVVINGVKNEEELSLIKEVNCQYVQGLLFSDPVDEQTATNLLIRGELMGPPVYW
jgi:diguanylate cyclase (GGDEF)-like protein/PAS domain S-box-containing protein